MCDMETHFLSWQKTQILRIKIELLRITSDENELHQVS